MKSIVCSPIEDAITTAHHGAAWGDGADHPPLDAQFVAA